MKHIALFARSRALHLLLRHFVASHPKRFYAREAARIVGYPMGAVQRHLIRLESEGILKSERVGPLKYYYLNEDHAYFPEIRSLVAKAARREQLEQALESLLKLLKTKYRPERVLLFGSLASGKITPNSDLDLLIIKKGLPRRYYDRVKQVAPLFSASPVGVDYLIWTPREWEKARRGNLFVENEILHKGEVVYERRR